MERMLIQRITPIPSLPPLRRVLHLARLWRQRAHTRQQLAALDDRQLADIGISHSERLDELNKPFWR